MVTNTSLHDPQDLEDLIENQMLVSSSRKTATKLVMFF